MYSCLAVNCHLHFWQNDQDLLRATVVTWVWNGYWNKSQHRKLTLEKKISHRSCRDSNPRPFSHESGALTPEWNCCLWQVINNETGKVLHVINATEPSKGNWMRYVNCARFFEEQNIVSVQEGSEIYYKALKVSWPVQSFITEGFCFLHTSPPTTPHPSIHTPTDLFLIKPGMLIHVLLVLLMYC